MFDGDINERKQRARKPKEGTHRVFIQKLSILKTRDHGEVPMVTCRIAASQSDQVGAEVGEAWFVNDGTELQRSYTRGDALAFGRAIAASLGQDPGNTDAVKAMMKSLFQDPTHQANQPVMGLELACTTSTRRGKDGNIMTAKKTGEVLLNSVYAAVPDQTAEKIKAQRAQVEAWCSGAVTTPPATITPTVVTPPPAPAPAVAPAGGFLAGLGLPK